MKKLFNTLVIAFMLFACSTTDETNLYNNPFGINYTDYKYSNKAKGSIRYQDYGGSPIDLAIDSAYVSKPDSNNVFVLMYRFTGPDSLKLLLQNKTQDYNYHSNATEYSNLLMFAIFNNDTLSLLPSAESIQPQTESNTFNTVLNLHTSNKKGNFNGTVNNVVLIDSVMIFN